MRDTDKNIRLHPSGQDVPCQSGDTVLGALERQGYALPNNCRAGACGECKIRVRSGGYDQGLILDMALSTDDRAAGYGLMCMAKPTSDVLEIEWGTADARPRLFPPRDDMTWIVTDRISRTPRIVELRLRPVETDLRFWPGQYVMVGNPEETTPPRPYSIANAPKPDGEIVLLISHIPQGRTSGWLHDNAQPGTILRISGPYGTFIGDPGTETPVLCLAAGSGLAPILALTDAALRRGFPHPVTLLFSARTEADVFDKGLMAYWEATNPNFRFIRTLTGERGPALTGRLPVLLPELFETLADHSVFIAGNPEFVADCTDVVNGLGARPDLVHTEGFTPHADAEIPPPERLLK